MEPNDRIKQLEIALKEYGQHKEYCHWLFFVTEACDCGLHYAQQKEEDNAAGRTESKK